MRKEKIIITYRLFFSLLCLTGIYLNIIDKSMPFMGNGTCLNFYTLQSNIWVLILEIGLIIFTIMKNRGYIKKEIIYENMMVLKYMVTVAISLTFLVYWSMLAPYLDTNYLTMLSNILVHGIIPILMMIDFFLFDKEIYLRKRAIFLTLIPPLYYLIFSLIRAEISPTRLTAGSRYPYWFIDVDLFGWFGNNNGMGILYWVILMVFLVLGIGAYFYKLRWENGKKGRFLFPKLLVKFVNLM